MDFFITHVSERSRALAADVLESGWLSEGARVREFEAALSSRLGLANPVCLNSGTSALHLALAVAGIGPGDEVIIPAQTFVATGLAVLMQRATPVFADIDLSTGNISPASVKEKLTPRTAAIMPVHWAGYPCDMDEINEIGLKAGVAVIEDAAHAIGATYRGKPIGAVSRFTCFSFQAIKHLTTGDGGALCSLSGVDAEAAKARRWFGIARARSQPSILGERQYDLTDLGYKYHMNDVAAAIGLGNLDTFSARLARRQANGKLYREELAGVPGVTLLECAPDRTHAYWLFTILVDRREDFIRKLASEGIPASVVHLRIDKYSVLGGLREDLDAQAQFNARQVSIPVHENLTDGDIAHIVASIKSGW